MKVKSIAYTLTIALLCAALASALALSACGASTGSDASSQDQGESQYDYALVHPGVLTVATSPYFPPLEYLESGEIKGYDIALIKEIANRLGLTADIQRVRFESLVALVASGDRFDCAISAIAISSERAEQVAFTDPYLDANLAIVVLNDTDMTSKDQLNGQPVGTMSGTTGERWAQTNLPNSHCTPFKDTADMLAALRTGQIKAVIYDEPAAKSDLSGEYDDCQVLELISTGDQYGIVVNTSNVSLAVAINDAIAEMLADGTVAKLRAEWFGEK